MSSMHRNAANPSESTTKKKFGKNLNKQLSKPPAPPIAGSGRGSTSASSRNGLLLLSTKRSSSAGNAAASGMLSSKATTSPTKPQQPLGLTTESYSSAHDALLGAVIGASRMTDTQQAPDAWGVAEKQTSSAPESDGARGPTLAPKGGVSSGVSSYQPVEHGRMDVNHSQYSTDVRSPSTQGGLSRGVAELADSERQSRQEPGEMQGSIMSQDARDRAEKRRMEEERRFNEQKDRAAQRLRELEKKMSMEKPKDVSPRPMPVALKARENPDSRPVILEALDSSQGRDSKGLDSDLSGERAPTRTLFDPGRTYSSSVASNSKQSNEEEAEASNRQCASADHKNGRSESLAPQNGGSTNEQTTTPMIHLSSYEDRDRGERNSSAGPRMLFDPKSGSMVAVSSRDEGTSGGRGKKGNKPKGRKDRDNGTTSRDKGEGGAHDMAVKSKKSKGRKDDTTPQRRDGKRSESKDASLKEETKPIKGRAGRVPPAEDRLPRTRGVLYARDERGNCYCADGCDGDQGYGSHSVRGGRLRNPVEYAKLAEQEEATGLEGYDYAAGYEDDYAYYNTQDSTFDASPSNAQASQVTAKAIDWVKPNEKIELVTGANDSPTLQATASPWAPSNAVFTAAASKAKDSSSTNYLDDHLTVTDDEEEDSDDDDDHPAFVGLGFDPTENMDAVMQSPSMIGASPGKLDSVELSALALDAPSSSEPTSRNLFAFGTSSTWGTGGTGTDWAMLGNGPNSSSGVGNSGQEKPAGPASFLSLSTGNPWGSPGLSGFGGTGMSGSTTGGPGPSSAGD